MNSSAASERLATPRHSILDLAPLELECMNALWPLGEGTVRDIHQHLAVSRPRAYTTILTIMDRLAQKGIVTRQKVGRAFRYQPNVSAEAARSSAVEKIIAGFFAGSADALALHLSAYRQGAANTSKPEHGAPIHDESASAAEDAQLSNLDETLQ
jgi:predicted transcriptional regulator